METLKFITSLRCRKIQHLPWEVCSTDSPSLRMLLHATISEPLCMMIIQVNKPLEQLYQLAQIMCHPIAVPSAGSQAPSRGYNIMTEHFRSIHIVHETHHKFYQLLVGNFHGKQLYSAWGNPLFSHLLYSNFTCV